MLLDLYINQDKRKAALAAQINKEKRFKRGMASPKKARYLKRKSCSHGDYIYEKFLFINNTYHYKETCVKCGKWKWVPHSRKLYDLTRKQPWQRTKTTWKKIKQRD